MCGFFFNICDSKFYSSKKNIESFFTIKHRGLDNSSFIELKKNKNIFLGHHRLAINDLSNRANQPFNTECQNYYLLFNGEIFNFKELKNNINFNFKTNSDTELILIGYKMYGTNFLKKLEGFFSILIVDLIKNKIILTVDPTSCKTAYYFNDDNSISIASELSCFETIFNKDIMNKIDLKSLQIYLQFGFIHAPYTIYKNISKLEPGELIEYDLDTFERKNLKQFNNHFHIKSSKNYYNLIIDAHKSRLVSDVKIAKMLSSGVDSTVSNFIYKEILNQNEDNVYTLKLKQSKLDESELAIKQTKVLNLKHKIINVDNKDIISEFIKICKYFDEPFADSSSILVSILSKEISKKYKVAISSDGGDELLFGYSRHKFFYLFKWTCHIPQKVKKIFSYLIQSNFVNSIAKKFKIEHFDIKVNKISSFLKQSDPILAYYNLLKIIPDEICKKIMTNYQSDDLSNSLIIPKNDNFIKNIDYKFYLPSINYKNDRCGMHYSLEIREPFLNFELVRNFYINKPKINDIFFPKKVFRKILSRRKLKITKKKRGFSFSQTEILQFNNFYLLNLLEENLESVKNIFDINLIKNLIKEFKSSNKLSTELWSVLTFTLWLKYRL